MHQQSYYPIFVELRNRRCLVIGGGAVAERRVAALLRCGARVTLVSPTATKRLLSLARHGALQWCRRRFRSSDLRGIWLVCAATNDEAVNRRLYHAGTRMRIFINVADQKTRCSFVTPAVVSRGPLTIAISTGGTSPSLAKKLRQELDAALGGGYAAAARVLAALRPVARARLPRYRDRARYFDELLSGRTWKLLRSGKRREARGAALRLLGEFSLESRGN